MTANASRRRVPLGPLLAAPLALGAIIAVSAWGVRRSADPSSAEGADWGALPARDAPIESALADAGADLFRAHCSACHVVYGAPKLGPNLAGVTTRREPAWIRAMILRADSMTRDDPVAAALKREHGGVQMMVVGTVSPADARAILEFLRRVDQEGAGVHGG